ncbi:MAG: TetR/AcrR family transcriptional regulator [Fidelibacterota bacterium]|jgi:AcrR family transcriptional regulator|tara:strand:- start:4712 stop:5308 length:597 start_codon:yes stop_codon:yes gene_type:complete
MSISERQLEERQMRKDRILEGALKVFKEKGLEGAKMDEIANSAGFGKATLYYYFKSKEDVFSAILNEGWIKIWESLEPVIASEESPRKTFVNLLMKIAENAQRRPGLFEFLFNAPKAVKLEEQLWKEYQNRLYTVIQGLLEDGIKAGEFPKINPQLMFKALGGLFMGLVFMGDRKNPISKKEIEKLLNQLITDPHNGK